MAGPVEATAVGNLLVQAIASGELPSLADGRAARARGARLRRFEPRDHDDVGELRALSQIGALTARSLSPLPVTRSPRLTPKGRDGSRSFWPGLGRRFGVSGRGLYTIPDHPCRAGPSARDHFAR